MQQQRWERLGDRIKILISPEHRFGTDAFLLARFASPRPGNLVCDLGSGCGIIPLLWFRWQGTAPKTAYAVEIQPEAVSQLVCSVAENQLQERLIPLCCDLRQLRGRLPLGAFDLVSCNPPYKGAAQGILSRTGSDRIARHETLCTIQDVAAAASSLLRFSGRACFCQRPERLVDTLEAMRCNKIEPKRIRFVQQRQDTAPWLFLVEGRKGSNPHLRIEPPLIIEDAAGGFSKELLEIYGLYCQQDGAPRTTEKE